MLCCSVEGEQRAAARQIVRHESRLQVRIRRVRRVDVRALGGIGDAGQQQGVPIGVEAHGIVSGVGDSELEVLEQPGLLDLRADT